MSLESVRLELVNIVVKGNSWSLSIEKSYGEAEPRIIFSGNPTMSEFRRAFEVLAKAEVANVLKEAIEKIQNQMKIK